MHKFFTPEEYISNEKAKIIGDDVKHIYKVLRLNSGDKVIINNCNGMEFLGEINSISKTEVIVDILEKLTTNNESNIKISLFQGMPKAQKMDLIVQKGTELGVYEFIPVITERVDVKLKGDFKKIDRLNKIAKEAAKKSKTTIIPKVLDVVDFNYVIDNMSNYDLFIVPYENAESYGVKALIKDLESKGIKENIKKVAVLIGPEGGFEDEEISMLKDKGAYIITLGNRILRTETAGFTAASLIQYELGDLGGKI